MQRPEAALQQPVEYVFPELILGGEWTSSIRLANRSSNQIPTTNVYFMDYNGNPMTATFQTSSGNVVTGPGFSFSLVPGGVLQVKFAGGSNTVFGHAFVDLCDSAGNCIQDLYGEVTLLNHNSTRPDFESVFPIEQPAQLQYMLFDHRNGYSTTLYLVNNNTSTTTVTLTFTDPKQQDHYSKDGNVTRPRV